MNKLTPDQIIDLQRIIRRGTIVKVHNQAKDVFIEAEFDGFSEESCPYRYCELHPKNPNKRREDSTKPCDGFMRWIIEGKEQEACPYLGGLYFTAGDQQIVTEIRTKEKDKVVWKEPEKYLK